LKKSTLHTSLNKSENSEFKIQKHSIKFKWVLVEGIIFHYIPSPYLFPQPQSFLDFIKDQRLYSTSTFWVALLLKFQQMIVANSQAPKNGHMKKKHLEKNTTKLKENTDLHKVENTLQYYNDAHQS